MTSFQPNAYSDFQRSQNIPTDDYITFSSSDDEQYYDKAATTGLLGGSHKTTREMHGIFNQHSFMVTNFNSIIDFNKDSLAFSGLETMKRVVPIGGHNIYRYQRFLSYASLSNHFAVLFQWFLTYFPLILLFFTVLTRSSFSQFLTLYINGSIFCITVGVLVFVYMNVQLFEYSQFVIAVLDGLRNNFKTVSSSGLRALAALTDDERLNLQCKLEMRPQNTKIRLMFYSMNYYWRYVKKPLHTLTYICILQAFCVFISSLYVINHWGLYKIFM